MKRVIVALGCVLAVAVAYVLAHAALIEIGNEVIVLRTQEADGSWYESRLWIVDDDGASWLHGNRGSRWMENLAARPTVEVRRAGETHRYRAAIVPGPHPRIHERMREKYGAADRWVRFVGPDGPRTAPVRLERM